MKMIVLRKEQKEELEKINEEHAYLYRGLMPSEMKDGNYALNTDVLEDKVTWAEWINFLEELPVKEIDADELV